MRGRKEIQKELKPNEVEIQFTDMAYAQHFGCKPVVVHRETADKYIEKNVAKIVRNPPDPNIIPPSEVIQTIEPIRIDPEKAKVFEVDLPPLVSGIIQNPYSTSIVWIGSNEMLRKVRKAGINSGFNICEMTPLRLHVASALVSDVVIISSNLSDYDEYQRISINILLHQKRVPYILVAEEFDEVMDSKRIINCILNAKTILFSTKELMSKWFDSFSEIITDWIIFDEPYRFWKEVGLSFGGIKNG